MFQGSFARVVNNGSPITHAVSRQSSNRINPAATKTTETELLLKRINLLLKKNIREYARACKRPGDDEAFYLRRPSKRKIKTIAA
jgi:hypothetical protein